MKIYNCLFCNSNLNQKYSIANYKFLNCSENNNHSFVINNNSLFRASIKSPTSKNIITAELNQIHNQSKFNLIIINNKKNVFKTEVCDDLNEFKNLFFKIISNFIFI